MSISAKTVRFDGNCLRVDLSNGRVIGAPLAWFPRLLAALAEALERYELSPHGIHWDELDEDISVAGVLAGHDDLTRARVSTRT